MSQAGRVAPAGRGGPHLGNATLFLHVKFIELLPMIEPPQKQQTSVARVHQ
jgi:hypothetical protein